MNWWKTGTRLATVLAASIGGVYGTFDGLGVKSVSVGRIVAAAMAS